MSNMIDKIILTKDLLELLEQKGITQAELDKIEKADNETPEHYQKRIELYEKSLNASVDLINTLIQALNLKNSEHK